VFLRQAQQGQYSSNRQLLLRQRPRHQASLLSPQQHWRWQLQQRQRTCRAQSQLLLLLLLPSPRHPASLLSLLQRCWQQPRQSRRLGLLQQRLRLQQLLPSLRHPANRLSRPATCSRLQHRQPASCLGLGLHQQQHHLLGLAAASQEAHLRLGSAVQRQHLGQAALLLALAHRCLVPAAAGLCLAAATHLLLGLCLVLAVQQVPARLHLAAPQQQVQLAVLQLPAHRMQALAAALLQQQLLEALLLQRAPAQAMQQIVC
jgi:hypothetical protein